MSFHEYFRSKIIKWCAYVTSSLFLIPVSLCHSFEDFSMEAHLGTTQHRSFWDSCQLRNLKRIFQLIRTWINHSIPIPLLKITDEKISNWCYIYTQKPVLYTTYGRHDYSFSFTVQLDPFEIFSSTIIWLTCVLMWRVNVIN